MKRLLLVLSLSALTCRAFGVVTWTQGLGTDDHTTNTCAVTLTGTGTSGTTGSTLVFILQMYNPGVHTATISDGANVYQLLRGIDIGGAASHGGWYSWVAKNTAGGTITTTATFSGGASVESKCIMWEISGIPSPVPDGTGAFAQCASGCTTTWDSGAATVSAGSVLIGYGGAPDNRVNSVTAGTSFTVPSSPASAGLMGVTANWALAAEYILSGSAGSQNATMVPAGTAVAWGFAIVAIKNGTPPPPVPRGSKFSAWKPAFITGIDTINLVAGAIPRVYGYAGDGASALSANFTWTTGLTTDPAGNVYVADIYSGTNAGRIRVINTQSTTQTLYGVSVCAGCVQTIAGNGTAGSTGDGGAATSAELNHPCYVSIDAAGNMYIADQANHTIRKITPAGIISTFAGGGLSGHCSPCAATNAVYVLPQAAVVGPDQNVYISDSNYNLLEVVNTHGTTQTIFGVSVPAGDSATIAGSFGVTGNGVRGDGGLATSASLGQPLGLGFDAAGNLYFADQENNVVRKIDHSTNIISTVAGSISKTSITNVVATGTTITYTYTLTSGPALTVGTNMDIKGCTSAGNNVLIGGPNFSVLRITSLGSGTFTVASTNGVTEAESGCTAWGGSQGYSGDDGLATSAQLFWPYDVKVNSAGDILISDAMNNVIRRVDHATGIITGFAGLQYTYAAEEAGNASIAGGKYGGDGHLATNAYLNFVVGIWPVPEANTVYVGDSGNSLIRKLTP